jgi:outer membrane receptor protein involved in Fe transport
VISDPPRRALDRDDEYVGGYAVVNVAVTRTFAIGDVTHLTLGIGANNIADVARPTLIPGLVGRQYFAQMSLRL